MSDTVKLIIEISKEHYESTKKLDKRHPYMLAGGETAIAHGIPLDDVKAEIKRMEYHMIDCEVLVSQEEVLEILDNIGKGETNEQTERG